MNPAPSSIILLGHVTSEAHPFDLPVAVKSAIGPRAQHLAFHQTFLLLCRTFQRLVPIAYPIAALSALRAFAPPAASYSLCLVETPMEAHRHHGDHQEEMWWQRGAAQLR